MRNRDRRAQPLSLATRTVDEAIADTMEGASALLTLARGLNPEVLTANDVAAANALLLGLVRAVGDLRRSRHQ
jgi:hypothetical protein